MSDQVQNRRKFGRTATWTCLAAVPALAIAVLGTNVLPTVLAAPSVNTPSGMLVTETRSLNNCGDDVTVSTARPAANDIDEFMNSWQNTVRVRPSPRR